MVILIVGKTCSGKDTVARRIEEMYGFHRIISYTTRPMRPDDVEGVSHYFLTKEEREKFDDDDIFSPTFIDGWEYFILKSQLCDGNCVYIVDPKGVEDVQALGVESYAVYIDCPEELILSRAAERNTDPGVVKSRLDSERERFDSFRDFGSHIGFINNNESVDCLKSATDTCMMAIASLRGMPVSSSKPWEVWWRDS